MNHSRKIGADNLGSRFACHRVIRFATGISKDERISKHLGRAAQSLVPSLARSFARGIHRKRVRKVTEGPFCPEIDLPTSASHGERKRGVAPRGPPVAHVLDRGSTGLRSSRGSYVPFCINRETPRRTRTSGRFWNRLNPPALHDQKG